MCAIPAAILGLRLEYDYQTIVVLGVSDRKFAESTRHDSYVQYDFGYTELPAGTPTAMAWVEDEKEIPKGTA